MQPEISPDKEFTTRIPCRWVDTQTKLMDGE